MTFLRFFPWIKARYDYGLLIFILTFCLISVSGYRDEEILEMAHKRVSTILIGAFTAVSVCVFIRPVWAGDDLHNSVATNIEKLGSFLEGTLIYNELMSGMYVFTLQNWKNKLTSFDMTITGFGSECFKKSCKGESNKAFLQGYCSVLNSKQSEESQVSLNYHIYVFLPPKNKNCRAQSRLRYKKSFSQIIY